MFYGYVNQRVSHPIGERIIQRVNQFSHENWLVVVGSYQFIEILVGG
jgi:hypothetical protein